MIEAAILYSFFKINILSSVLLLYPLQEEITLDGAKCIGCPSHSPFFLLQLPGISPGLLCDSRAVILFSALEMWEEEEKKPHTNIHAFSCNAFGPQNGEKATLKVKGTAELGAPQPVAGVFGTPEASEEQTADI